jgi:hypothetical protein
MRVVESVDQLLEDHPQLFTLCHAHSSDPYDLLKGQPNLFKFAESYNTLLTHQTEKTIRSSLQHFFARTANPFDIFPTSEEISQEILPIVSPLRTALPFYSTNLNLSAPVSDSNTTSLNVLIRLYDSEKRNRIKIKVGAFVDGSSEVFWEVGFVDAMKSLRNIFRDQDNRFSVESDYSLLRKLVDCTKQFIIRRPQVSGLDLTPAYYHVLQLCRRLGGKTVNPFNWTIWLQDLEHAYNFSLRQLKDNVIVSNLQKVHQRFAISWMFDQLLLSDASGKLLKWQPPRLICRRDSFC